jgi:phosphoribosylanthranilate isomerase
MSVEGAPVAALRFVGFCGADDTVDPRFLKLLSDAHPFIEWGILFRPGHEGTARFASLEWVQRLAACKAASHDRMHLAAHLCGSRCTEVLQGDGSFVRHLHELGFARVQVNATKANGVNLSGDQLVEAAEGLAAAIASVPEIEWIIQRNDETRFVWEPLLAKSASLPNMSILFDDSVGTGVEISSFPAPLADVPCGYAGGIGPKNIGRILECLPAVGGGDDSKMMWIDMESNVRSQVDGRDDFDLHKVFDCIQQVRGANVHLANCTR